MSNTSEIGSAGRSRGARLAVVVSGWPRLSETFAVNELIALDRAGMLAAVFATKADLQHARHPGHEYLDALVTVLPAGDSATQARCLVTAAAELEVTGVHGYFAHKPAAIARHAAALLGVPFGFSTHALDVRKVAADKLADRARAACTVIACNADVAASIEALGVTPTVLPHGVDLARFAPRPTSNPRRDDFGPLRILAVGRLVEKKGFDVLLDALAVTHIPHELVLVGDGELRESLVKRASRLEVDSRVTFAGSLHHGQLPEHYAAADVVVVPSVVDHGEDRDGLPNVILEAMASGVTVVASRVAAIPTAIDHQRTGVLFEPGNSAALARALDALAVDPMRRHLLSSAARATVATRFDLESCGDALCRVLDAVYTAEPRELMDA